MPSLSWSRILIGTTIVCLAGLPSRAPGQDPPQLPRVEIPASATSLEGVPSVRIESAEKGTTRRVLNTAEAARDRLMISVVDGRFYWTSRGNRPLQLSSTGEFTYLSSEPGKYVRLTRLNDKITYVEHIEMATENVTWWGELRIVAGK